jgi:hypothetical protein
LKVFLDANVLFSASLSAQGTAQDGRRHFGHLFGERLEGVLVLSLRAALDHLAARPRVSHDPAVRRTRKSPKAK